MWRARDGCGVKPLAIELFAGTMSWTAGWRELGGYSVGFDIEHLPHHGPVPEGADLVIQDVLTLHGSQFRNASLIVASPPCQNYSYLAMPWSRSKDPNNSKAAKALRKDWETNGSDNRLFDACFRIQREASEAAGRYIPLIVENVRGAVPWVGPSKANFGSFHLWGDVAQVGKRIVRADAGFGAAGLNSGRGGTGVKVPAKSGPEYGGGFGWDKSPLRQGNSHSNARKAASAQIAMIPPALSRHIAEIFWPAGHALVPGARLR